MRSPFARFCALVAIPNVPDLRVPCWNWIGVASKRRNKGRSPRFSLAGKMVRAHRLSLSWHKGPPPTPKHEAGHTCPDGENDLCVNPYHLEWMTRTENERSKRR